MRSTTSCSSPAPDSAPALQIVPSILAADFGRLREEIASVDAFADRYQIDIMDGHFVPNISMGPMFVATCRAATARPLEAHLMVARPQDWIETTRAAGADLIIVHAETAPHLNRLLEAILKSGARAAVALNPASPLVLIEEVLDQVSLVLLMTVNPGFGGQRFLAGVTPKIRRLRDRLQAVNPACEIEVDGGIDAATIGLAHAAGANAFVAGSSVFGHEGGARAGVEALRQALCRQ